MNISDLNRSVWRVSYSETSEWNTTRYSNVSKDIKAFITSYRKIETIDGQAWLLSASDFTSESESEFLSDEFERISLSAAENDVKWQQEIRAFWDKHLPIYMSVGNGYEYIAYNLETGKFVAGAEPEFEETFEVASSISEFLKYVNDRNT